MSDNVEQIWNYILGEMTAKESQSFEDIIKVDPKLRSQMELIRNAHEQLQQEELQSPSRHFTDRVMSAIPPYLDRSLFHVPAPPSWLLWAIPALTVVLMAISMVSEGGWSSGKEPTQLIASQWVESLSSATPVYALVGIIGLLVLDRVMGKKFRATP